MGIPVASGARALSEEEDGWPMASSPTPAPPPRPRSHRPRRGPVLPPGECARARQRGAGRGRELRLPLPRGEHQPARSGQQHDQRAGGARSAAQLVLPRGLAAVGAGGVRLRPRPPAADPGGDGTAGWAAWRWPSSALAGAADALFPMDCAPSASAVCLRADEASRLSWLLPGAHLVRRRGQRRRPGQPVVPRAPPGAPPGVAAWPRPSRGQVSRARRGERRPHRDVGPVPAGRRGGAAHRGAGRLVLAARPDPGVRRRAPA